MTVYDRRFRLADGSRALGVSFDQGGLSLAGAPLLQRTIAGLAPRPADELGMLMKGAYGGEPDVIALTDGLHVVAQALNRGDEARAMIAALRLRLAEVDWRGAVRIAAAQNALAKYSPDQPRDWHGRWTDGDGDRPASGGNARAARASMKPSGPPPAQAPSKPPQADSAAEPTSSWVGPVHLEGGRLIPIAGGGIGGNGPPEDAEEIPPPTPVFPVQRPPLGTEPDRMIVGGLEYKIWQTAKLLDGSPWPVATVTSIRATINAQKGRTPQLRIYVPINGYGDVLLGSTPQMDLPQAPEGYEEVLLRGRPQVTSSRGQETGHADDGVEEALRLAKSNAFKEICFNLSFTNCTDMVVQSLIRPDVLAIVRPRIETNEPFWPYETLSGRQTRNERQQQMPDVWGIRRIDTGNYKVALAEFLRMRELAKALRPCS